MSSLVNKQRFCIKIIRSKCMRSYIRIYDFEIDDKGRSLRTDIYLL